MKLLSVIFVAILLFLIVMVTVEYVQIVVLQTQMNEIFHVAQCVGLCF